MSSTDESCMSFAERVHSTDQATDTELYVRLRAGQSRARAKSVLSSIGLEDDAAQLAAVLEDHLSQLDGEEDPVAVLELMEVGGRTPLLAQRIAVPRSGRSSSSTTIAPTGLTEMSHGFAILAGVVQELSMGYQRLAHSAILRLEVAQVENRDLASQVAAYDAVAEVSDTDSRDRLISDGLTALSPLAYAVAMKLGLPVAALLGAAEDPAGLLEAQRDPGDIGGQADRVVGELEELLSKHPEILTQARGQRVIQAAIKARGAQPSPKPSSDGE